MLKEWKTKNIHTYLCSSFHLSHQHSHICHYNDSQMVCSAHPNRSTPGYCNLSKAKVMHKTMSFTWAVSTWMRVKHKIQIHKQCILHMAGEVINELAKWIQFELSSSLLQYHTGWWKGKGKIVIHFNIMSAYSTVNFRIELHVLSTCALSNQSKLSFIIMKNNNIHNNFPSLYVYTSVFSYMKNSYPDVWKVWN